MKNPIATSRVFLSVIFAALIVVSGLTACGAGGQPDQIASPSARTGGLRDIVVPTSIAEVKAAWIAEPVRGTEYYYCDCGTGAELGCVAGNDANTGTSKSAPRRTISNAVDRSNSLGATLSTISFCKGGAFNAPETDLFINAPMCPEGETCRDMREYIPTTFVGTATPIINKPGTSGAQARGIFNLINGKGGIRFFNLKLQGNGILGAFFLYNGSRDVVVANMEVDGFQNFLFSGISTDTQRPRRILITGNTITNSTGMGFLGAADSLEISNNLFDGNGGSVMYDHSIYLSGHVEPPVDNVSIHGNVIRGQYGPTCYGSMIVVHGGFDGLNILNNYIEVAEESATAGCYGIELSHGGYPDAVFFRNLVVSGNTIINGGATALAVGHAPSAVIENNLIIQDWVYASGEGAGWAVTGISLPSVPARTAPVDDASTANIIRNNTVWFSSKVVGGATGIKVSIEGAGHNITNNTITYSSATAGQGVNCLDMFSAVNVGGTVYPPLTLGSYAAVNYNHCYSAAAYKWEKTNGTTLALWKTYSGKDLNSISGSAPLFVNATSASGRDFKPGLGSPLIGPPVIGAYGP